MPPPPPSPSGLPPVIPLRSLAPPPPSSVATSARFPTSLSSGRLCPLFSTGTRIRVMETTEVLPTKPDFKALKAQEMLDAGVQFRKVAIPPHLYTPIYNDWEEIYDLVYNQMKVDIRMNTKARRVELKTRPDTPEIGHLQKCADFVYALALGFVLPDAKALLQTDESYVESFEIKDVKTLRGEHLSRAIGRLCGKSGKTKFAIENSTRTRIVIADTKIHILGAYSRIKMARNCLCSLILGSPAAKVYSKLRQLSSRLDSIAA